MCRLSLEFYVPRDQQGIDSFPNQWSSILRDASPDLISVTRGTGTDYCETMHLDTLRAVHESLSSEADICSHLTLSHLHEDTFANLSQGTPFVSEVLVLSGDQGPSAYAVQHGLSRSADLLSFIDRTSLHREHSLNLNATFYPGGHYTSDYNVESDVLAVREKVESASIRRLISQWSLLPEAQIAHARKLKGLGRHGLPCPELRVGYMPMRSAEHAKRVATVCKADSAEFNAELARSTALFENDILIRAREDFKKIISSGLFGGVHLFTMNNLDLTAKLVEVWQDTQELVMDKQAYA